MQELLCLPVRARRHSLIKVVVCLMAGGLLCPCLLWSIEGLATYLGADAGLEFLRPAFDPIALVKIIGAFWLLTLIGFYASTLARESDPGACSFAVIAGCVNNV